ncbi:MAG: hypothetical protein ACLQQ4_08345 [Bacteroidia bacterium]
MGLINKTNIHIEKNKTKEELEAEMRIAETQADASKSAERIIAEARIKQEQKEDKLSRPWAHDENFYSNLAISEIVFPENIENTYKTIEAIISKKRKELKDYIDKEIKANVMEYVKFMIYGWVLRIPSIIQAFGGTPKIVNDVRPSLDKIQEGLKKLKQLDNYETNYNAHQVNTDVKELNRYLETIQSKTKQVMTTKVILAVVFWVALIVYSELSSHHHGR